jgi:type II secretory pathway pseudopilin PulG
MPHRMPRGVRACRSAGGFTLLEVLVALGCVVAVVAGSAQLVSIAVRSNRLAGAMTVAVVLAEQKLEEILSADVPSPAGSLAADVDGCFDFVDERGHVLGGGATPTVGAGYFRRWSIEPLAGNVGDMLVVQVLVTDARNAAPPVRIAAAKTRRAF